jgi:hypothetical protein
MSLEKFKGGKGLRTDGVHQCPIAALAGKSQCLGSSCGWYTPRTNTGCMILETGQLALNATKALQELKKDLDDLQEDIRKQLDILEKATKQTNASEEESHGSYS